MLAEISDKMPTITVLWLLSLALSVPLLPGIMAKRLSWLPLFVALGSCAWLVYSVCHLASLEGSLSDDVHREMGWWWIANLIASACLPAIVALVVFCSPVRKHRTIRQAVRV